MAKPTEGGHRDSEADRTAAQPLTRRRITVGRMLAAIVPLAVYLALFAEVTGAVRRNALQQGIDFYPEVSRVATAVELVLLALSSCVLAAYRRAPFVGVIVQLTTTPLVPLTILGAARWDREAFLLVTLSWVGASLPSLVALSVPGNWVEPRRGLVLEVFDSFTVGATNIILLIPFACCGATIGVAVTPALVYLISGYRIGHLS